MKITRIKPPKYRVGRNVLNEYELRQLLLDIASKDIILTERLKVTDMQTKEVAYFDQVTNQCNCLTSMSILTELKNDRLRAVRELG